MLFTVICYAIHDKSIEEYKAFNSRRKALDFLKESVERLYNELTCRYGTDDVEVREEERKTELEYHPRGYEWTWQIIEIDHKCLCEHEHEHCYGEPDAVDCTSTKETSRPKPKKFR